MRQSARWRGADSFVASPPREPAHNRNEATDALPDANAPARRREEKTHQPLGDGEVVDQGLHEAVHLRLEQALHVKLRERRPPGFVLLDCRQRDQPVGGQDVRRGDRVEHELAARDRVALRDVREADELHAQRKVRVHEREEHRRVVDPEPFRRRVDRRRAPPVLADAQPYFRRSVCVRRVDDGDRQPKSQHAAHRFFAARVGSMRGLPELNFRATQCSVRAERDDVLGAKTEDHPQAVRAAGRALSVLEFLDGGLNGVLLVVDDCDGGVSTGHNGDTAGIAVLDGRRLHPHK